MGYFGLQFLMSNGTQWKVVGNEARPRPADQRDAGDADRVSRTAPWSSTPGSDFVLTLSGNGNAYVYDSTLGHLRHHAPADSRRRSRATTACWARVRAARTIW